MNRTLPLLALSALAACAPAATQQVAPEPSPVVAAAPQAQAPADTAVARPAEAAPAPAPSMGTRVASAVRSPADPAPADTVDEFLDSLHALPTDTVASAPVAVAREAVRDEAASLFGLPADAAPTWDIDVASYAEHERVQYWMGYFTGRSRWHFERYLERLGRYDSMIRTRLANGGLPRDMIYLAMIESGFNQLARSRSGAVGLWQFMPSTGRLYGLEVSTWVDDRRDPSRSTDAAIRFLSDLNARFGSLYLAAAAYNGGPGRVQRGLRRGDFDGMENRDEVFFAMADEGSRYFRRETRDYVPKLIAAALLAKEPARYGFTDLQPWTPLVYDSIVATDAVGLDVVARLSGTTQDAIEELNPRFFRGVTPPGRRVWVKVPVGTGDSVSARLATLPPSERVTIVTHFVERGETLSGIARRYHVTVADIREANHLRSNRLSRGQRLVIPTSAAGHARSATQATRSSRSSASRSTAGRSASTRATTTRSAASRTSSSARATASRRMHVVREGETLSGIAERFHVSQSSLMSANNLTSRSVIRPGQSLRIPQQ